MPNPTILITGATGFLGAAALTQLLRTRPDCRVLALVRAASAQEGAARLAKSLERFDEGRLPRADPKKVELLIGDLTDGEILQDARLNAVTHVLHAAANTSFRSVRSVRRVNILGALSLAHRMRRAPNLVRYVHVGTAFSCGVDVHSPVAEDEYPRDGARHAVEYSASKAEAELLLEATAPELPLVIARPSVVIGHTRLGCGPSGSIFWTYRAMDLLRRIAWPLESRDDVIPVDYAADTLLYLLFKPTLAHRRYHVSAGLGASCSWHEIAAAFARHHGERPGDPYRIIDVADLPAERPRLRAALGSGDEERMLMALALYYSFPTLVFDNTRLLAEAAPAPPRFVDYLDACMANPAGRSVYAQMTDDD